MVHAGNDVWEGGDLTPFLRWYDGTPTPFRILVHPFSEGDDAIIVEWWNVNGETWVDFPYTGIEEGTFFRPYNTFSEGVSAVPRDGTLHIKTGNSSATGRVTKRMRIQSYNGPVVIGPQ